MLTVNGTDISEIAYNVRYSDTLNNGASALGFDYPAAKAEIFPNGSVVIFSYGGVNLFYGFLFTSKASENTVSCTAYDQLRYLKSQDFMLRKGETLTAFVSRILSTVSVRMSVGELCDSAAVLSNKIFDGKSYLDMIYQSVAETTALNGRLYALRDEFGAVTLRDVYDLRLGVIIGDDSLATGYSYTRSIDSDTYNAVKVGQDDKTAGCRSVIMAQDSESIAKWGRLLLYEKAQGQNEAQLKELAAALLLTKNRESESLTLSCMGDLRVRAGVGVRVCLAAAGVDFWAIVKRCEQEFNGALHTMRLELEYGRWQSWRT